MKKYLSFVKFEHTLFSLPMVFAGAFLAAHSVPGTRTILLILCAATGARTAAMAINRIVDAQIDAKNPRTKNRAIPTGTISGTEAYAVTGGGLAVYFASAYMICPLVFLLSPIPVAVFATYPYLKRVTPLCHFGVGAALALAPAGGWMAVRCSFDDIFVPLMLGIFTVFWVAGFDIIYSMADEEFDKQNGLRSVVQSLGREKALSVSTALHVLSVFPLIALQTREFGMNLFSLAALGALCAIFALEHVKASDTNFAFFKLNAGAGALVLVFTLCGIYFS
ncbi:MAG: 4-hydroxybenzoate octaprenyltransferase [Candidatus Mycalebacterium zealandia]|nr:MAG: 4-hydroxybenzoate octaprenyltransferase [Candidatus Mycalebacterium zealandia]